MNISKSKFELEKGTFYRLFHNFVIRKGERCPFENETLSLGTFLFCYVVSMFSTVDLSSYRIIFSDEIFYINLDVLLIVDARTLLIPP